MNGAAQYAHARAEAQLEGERHERFDAHGELADEIAVGGSSNLALASRRLHFLNKRLQMLLNLSSKESTKAFFYGSAEALQWTQRLLLQLWAYLISQVPHAPTSPSRSPTLVRILLCAASTRTLRSLNSHPS